MALNISTASSRARRRNMSRDMVRNTTVLTRRLRASGLSPLRRHRRRRHQMAARAAGIRPGQAVLHVLGARRGARPAPGLRRNGPTSIRASSTTAGTSIASAFSRSAKAKGWIPQDAQDTPRPTPLASWDSIPEDEKALPAPPDGSLRRVRRARRLQRRPRHRRDREARANSTTR